MRRYFAGLVMGCAALLGTAAQAQAVLDAGVERVDLWPHVTLLNDPEQALGIGQVLADRDRFAKPTGAYASLGLTRDATWLRVPLEVRDAGAGPWVLDFDYALLGNLDIYVLRDGKVVRQAKLGNAMPFAERPLRSRSHAMPIDLASGVPNELIVRVGNLGAKILPVSLSRPAAFHARALAEQFLQGALIALGLVLLVYSLAQWFTVREDLYLTYALLVLCSVMFSVHFFGIGEMYIWTDTDWLERHLAGITSLLAAAATALFIEDALAGDLQLWLRRGLRATAVINFAAAVAYGVDWMTIQTVGVFMSTTGLAPALLGLPGALARARRGDSVGAWFIVAWLGYFGCSAIMVALVRGHVGANFWTLHSFQFGATLDMLIFIRIAVLRTAARHNEAHRAARERDAMHSLAHSDPLTGLVNRRGLDDALAGALGRAGPKRLLAVYLMDLDGFKPVNDNFGHDVGDEVLRVIAQRLSATVRTGDGVARLGGDEFVVMAEGLPNAIVAEDLGIKILESFRSPFEVRGKSFAVGATVGYALAPGDAADAGSLIKAADAAMYAGKQAGKDRLVRGSSPQSA